MLILRPHLCRRIAEERVGVIFLRAPAGAGKTATLSMAAGAMGKHVCSLQQPRMSDVEDGWLFWDVPVSARSARLSAQLVETVDVLVIACRPDQRISGLARLILHRGSVTLDAGELTFSSEELRDLPPEEASRLLEQYAGWPAFLPLTRTQDQRLCIDYLRENFLAHLSPAQTASLSIWLEAPSSASGDDWAGLLPPVLINAADRHTELLRLLTTAVRERLATFKTTVAVIEVASAFEKAGRALAAMTLLLDHGHEAHAAQILERSRGLELIYRNSLEAFRDIIMRFSHEMIATNEIVLFALARTLLKLGELQRVRHLVGKHLGSDYLDPLKVLLPGSRFSFAARTFRLNLMICEDLMPTDAMITRLGEFMADYPMGDYGKWAAYYNALLEFEIRRRNFREAEAAAARAQIYHIHMGGQPLLEFFIHLHRTVLRLMSGDALFARRAAQDARHKLEQVPHAAEAEFRMLRLAEA